MRHKDTNWSLPASGDGLEWNHAEIAVLMDIRDALAILPVMSRKLSALKCPNFVAIPRALAAIKHNTTKRRKAKK